MNDAVSSPSRPARGRSQRALVRRVGAGATGRREPDHLVVEEPMEIHLDGTLVTTTMRTPGHDFELAVGFLHGEGLLGPAEVRQVRYCATGSALETDFNVVSVDSDGTGPAPAPRLGTTTSSCGLCGAQSIEALVDRLGPLPPAPPIPTDVLAAVPGRVRAAQELFEATGGVHAAATFDAGGEVALVREDIGRHNAVDKVVGRLRLDGALPAAGRGLFVSGRASFEMVQKAWAAGFGTVLAVSAPSALAVETAGRAGIVLAGFVRDGHFNLYSEPG